ncbi:Ger(x)C family spore germination protein [Fredinandcohnia humi]
MIKTLNLLKLLSLFLLLNCLTGCWDQIEIDKRAYVLGIGIDKSKDKGFIKVSYLISNPEVGSIQQGGGAANEPPHEIITFEAASFISSRDIANSIIAKSITYDILDIIVISEDMARSDEFIRYIYDATKDREIRRDTKLIVTKEKASDFLKNNKPKLETRLHEYFELILDNTNDIGLTTASQLNVFFRITEADADLFLAIYATTKEAEQPKDNGDKFDLIAGEMKIEGQTNKTQVLGSAVFKEGKMIGTLTGTETRLVQMLNKTMQNSTYYTSFPDPFDKEYRLAVRLKEKDKPKIVVDVSRPSPKIDATIPIAAEVLTDHSMVNYAEDVEKRNELREILEKDLEESFGKLIKKTKEEFKAQPFGFSLPARKSFMTIQQWEQYDWMKSYPNATVDVNVEITLGEFGRQAELPSQHNIKD